MRLDLTFLNCLVLLRCRAAVSTIVAAAVLLATMPALAAGRFSPSLFKFVPIVEDDGKDEAAGWQEASAQLNFFDTRSIIPSGWRCHIRVSVPLRAAAYGRISPEFAAEMTADIATDASTIVMHSKPNWLTAEFCLAFKIEMKALFDTQHLALGARVNSP